MKVKPMSVGVVTCLRLHIHSKPDLESEIVCKIRYLTEVVVDLAESTKDFYKVYTAVGAEGFCLRDCVSIKE